jgi:hypothetical protein
VTRPPMPMALDKDCAGLVDDGLEIVRFISNFADFVTSNDELSPRTSVGTRAFAGRGRR